jgi:hypothetical protein
MADIFETVIGMAEPALKVVGGFVEEVQATVQKVINNAVAEALKASGVNANAAAGANGGGGARGAVPPPSPTPPPPPPGAGTRNPGPPSSGARPLAHQSPSDGPKRPVRDELTPEA